ncbi:hypothetical protein BOTNAR_0305g00060 [Botryotinia narcissicola]|uniref:BTB domain-containing protein n=1 Tax=Botryotinia narcissicola TaxID=278944 RepID=A0A4Z1I831_9HELO|nr:hypothetical protein BOTNAR_0305g00060 [Botryotinia narcissicola]
MVTFIVGTGYKQETFQIHKQIACEHSEVWNRAFNSVFVEGQTQTYRIEDTDPEVFRLLTQWVYREEFDHVHSGDLNASHSDDFASMVRCIDEDSALLQLWVLAEKFMIPRLQNYTIRVLCNKVLICNPNLSYKDCRYVYDNTAEGSALRCFVIEHSCWSRAFGLHDRDLVSYPVEMLGDIIMALKRQLPENEVFSDDWGQLSVLGGSNYRILIGSGIEQFCEEWVRRVVSLVDWRESDDELSALCSVKSAHRLF